MTSEVIEKATHVSKIQIKGRGWTESLIARFLGEADATRKNPRYKSAAPMQLYLLSRVEATEETTEFKEAMEKSAIRKTGAKKAVESKRKTTLDWASSFPPPRIKAIDRKKLIKIAIDHYNELWASREDYDKYASIDSPEDFLNRITVNFIRHELTSYENRLSQTYRKIGKQEAVLHIKCTILDAIANVYPWLASECENQKFSDEYFVLTSK